MRSETIDLTLVEIILLFLRFSSLPLRLRVHMRHRGCHYKYKQPDTVDATLIGTIFGYFKLSSPTPLQLNDEI